MVTACWRGSPGPTAAIARKASCRGHRASNQQARRSPAERARRDHRRPRGPAHPARHPGAAGRGPQCRTRPGRRGRDHPAAAALRAAGRPRGRGPRRGRRSRNGNRDRGAQVRRAARVPGGDARTGPGASGQRAAEGLPWPGRPARCAAGDDRRRGRARFRRRGLLRTDRRPAQGLEADRRDCRCQSLREAGRRARRRGAEPLHVGVLPATRHPDAAGETLQRPVLAEPERRPPRDGVRLRDQRQGRGRRLPVLSRDDALACTADLHRCVGGAVGARLARRAARRRPAAAPAEPVCALRNAGAGPRGARCHRPRDDRNVHRVRPERAHRQDPAARAQRRPQADRGMHAGGQRVRRRFPRARQAAEPVPRARRTDAGAPRERANAARGRSASPSRAATIRSRPTMRNS